MKRAMLAMFVTFLPLAAAAQEPQTPATPSDRETTVSATASGVDAQAQPPAPRRATKRRGSMVGYIEDPSVASGVRVRFDAGWDLDSPDRAEFFYAKCGCYRDLAGTPLFDPEAPGPGPGVVTGMDYTQFNVLAEYAIQGRVSLFAELPFRSIKPSGFLTGTGSFDNQ